MEIFEMESFTLKRIVCFQSMFMCHMCACVFAYTDQMNYGTKI